MTKHPPNLVCERCGNPFYAKPSAIEREGRRFCSRACYRGDPEERFWRTVKRADSGCWEWTGGRLIPPLLPYGRFKQDGIEKKAHRASWEFVFGPIPKELWVLHKCDNPPCVNPFHLFLGTPSDNVQDAVRKGRWNPRTGPMPIGKGVGIEHRLAKLDEEKVRLIRSLYVKGKCGGWRLAKQFGVSKPAVMAVVNRETWKHVT